MLTKQDVEALIDYDPETGQFHWRINRGGNLVAGKLAGHVHTDQRGRQYHLIKICRQSYKAHRVAWLLCMGEWPASQIDHIDGDGLNNRINNLRLASQAENMRNRGCYRTNTSGFKGVTQDKRSGKWMAVIKVNGKANWLGLYSDPVEAHAAYCAAAAKLHGEFART